MQSMRERHCHFLLDREQTQSCIQSQLDAAGQAAHILLQLEHITAERPQLQHPSHPSNHLLRTCQQHLQAGAPGEAQEQLLRLCLQLEHDARHQLESALGLLPLQESANRLRHFMHQQLAMRNEADSISEFDPGDIRGCIQRRLDDAAEAAQIVLELDVITAARPFLEDGLHPFNCWLRRCRQHLRAGELTEARDELAHFRTQMETTAGRLKDAFSRFDPHQLGTIEVADLHELVSELSLAPEVATVTIGSIRGDRSRIPLSRFLAVVERMGGIPAFHDECHHCGSTGAGRLKTQEDLRNVQKPVEHVATVPEAAEAQTPRMAVVSSETDGKAMETGTDGADRLEAGRKTAVRFLESLAASQSHPLGEPTSLPECQPIQKQQQRPKQEQKQQMNDQQQQQLQQQLKLQHEWSRHLQNPNSRLLQERAAKLGVGAISPVAREQLLAELRMRGDLRSNLG
mmetsp:Transcript_36665/g.72537  ORF Transcript_36665/g.72537 Transcript_36665/m.72537 type:complete len:458 (+) Transcript_36665:37-1410(+)